MRTSHAHKISRAQYPQNHVAIIRVKVLSRGSDSLHGCSIIICYLHRFSLHEPYLVPSSPSPAKHLVVWEGEETSALSSFASGLGLNSNVSIRVSFQMAAQEHVIPLQSLLISS